MNKRWKIFFSILVGIYVLMILGIVGIIVLHHLTDQNPDNLRDAVVVYSSFYYFSPLAIVNIASLGTYMGKHWKTTGKNFRIFSKLTIIISLIWAALGIPRLIY